MAEYETVSPQTPEPAGGAPGESIPAGRAARRIDGQSILIALLLLLVMGSGAYFRFVGLNWDDFTHLHPDERFLTQVVTSIAPVSGIGEYFNTAESSLNPNNRGAGFYVYGTLPLFIVLWMIAGYGSAMGAPSFVKINANWFGLSERGIFTGIFGICTQAGSAIALSLSGFIVAAMHWRWAFIVPAVICLVYGALMYAFVRDRPEPEGFPSVDTGEDEDADAPAPGFAWTLKKVFTSRPILLVSAGYFCLGIVRYGMFVWYPDYLREVHHIATNSPTFQAVSVIIPFAGMAGALLAGWVSDNLFRARRAPVAVLFYLGQVAMMVVFYFVAGPVVSGVLFVFLSFFINGPHSLLGGAASMDFGGRKAAASAAGIIDAFQYLGMFVITAFGGRVIQSFGWNGWIVMLILASLVGAGLLGTLWNARPGSGHGAPPRRTSALAAQEKEAAA